MTAKALPLRSHLTYRGHDVFVYRRGFVGRIEIVFKSGDVGSLITRYTTRWKVGEQTRAIQSHDRAIGFAFGVIEGLWSADVIDDANAPTLTLLEGGTP